jgi:hypothetical protein
VSYLLPAKTELCRREPRLNISVAQRNRRVAKIMKILGSVIPKSEVEDAVIFHDTCYFEEERPGRYWIRTKKQKAAVNRLARALLRLKAAVNQKDLISTLRSDFPMNESDCEKWSKRVDQIAATLLPNPGRLNYAKRYAVQLVAEFLQCYDVELTKARNGKFCRVAEAFYGDGSVKLYHYCREYLTESPT